MATTPPPARLARVTAILAGPPSAPATRPVLPGEAAYFCTLRAACRDGEGAAFDALLDAGPSDSVSGVDLLWALPYHADAKTTAFAAYAELRGDSAALGGGVRCPRPDCRSDNTIAVPVQMRSGDEPTQLQIRCHACRRITVLG